MEFEFDFGQKAIAKGIEPNKKVYASVPGVAVPLSGEELVFLNRETGKNTVMTHQVLHALSLCQEFKPIEEHIQSIINHIPQLSNQTQAVEQVTEYLIKNQLLIEDKQWLEKISTSQTQSSIQSSGIVIRSCDRPDQLKRLIDSLINYQNQHNCNFNVQIYDDSTSEKHEKELEKLIKEYQQNKLNIQFYGSAWQKQFLRMLKEEFSENVTTIDWLLNQREGQFTGGRVWNFALLNNAGKKFLFFDDDYLFEPRNHSSQSQSIDFSDRDDLSVGFSSNLSEIKENTNQYKTDVLNEMINSCGQTIGNWLSTNNSEFNSIQNFNYQELQRITPNSVIKSTCNGTWGSPRSNSNYWLYFLEGEQKEEFWKSREAYLDNIEASNLMHYSDSFDLMSLAKFAPSAIDNSSLTPFASPVNRVEDHFFNCLMLYCYPNQVSLHYPFMMGHIQTQKRDRSGMNHVARRPNFNKFVADYALTLVDKTDAKSPDLRMKTLAEYIFGLADSDDFNIHNRLKEYITQVRSDIILAMQNQLAMSPGAPIYWQADVRELIEANGKAILKNDPPILDDWDENMSNEECITQAKLELNEVAEALKLWPEIWSFCKTK